jgi:ferric-dicitrate binding protein FerR (iron transport regulator)
MNDDMERFSACAEAYGADVRRWPAADRALHARCAATEAGAAILAAAARTDAFLDAWAPAPSGPALADGIADAVLRERPRRRRLLGMSLAAFAASAAFGFVVGFVQAPADPAADIVTLFIVGPAGMPGIGL